MKMRLNFLSLFLLICFHYAVAAQKTLRTIKNEAFKPGEILKFRIHYGFMDAGEAILEVKPDMQKIGERSCYHVVGTGESVGAFNWFFKVRDRYESIIDQDAIVPWIFIRRVNEGGYIINQNVSFNHFRNSVTSEKKTVDVPENTQDLISAFYYARTIDFNSASIGDIFPITGYLDDTTMQLNIKYIGKEEIKSKKGTFRCIKFRPMLAQGRVFKDQEGMTIWVSDDKNRIPVRVQSDILIGSIKMDLVDFENLVNEPGLVRK